MSAKNWRREEKLNVGEGCWADGFTKVSGVAVGREMLRTSSREEGRSTKESTRSEKGLEMGVVESLGGVDWWNAGLGLSGLATGTDGAKRWLYRS